MNVRGMIFGAWAVGLAMVGGACGPSDPMSTGMSSQAIAETEGAATDATGQICGGFAGLKCPKGYSCVDDPSDSCDPAHGGADCSDVCVKCGQEPGYHYVLTDPDKCAGARFKCASGQVAFFNDCGCGCKPE